ncbi:uncharacterized protein LOC126553522 isoform X2 [Aphis gossypii]|uniref:uncharacterized protein LOC126553522 isoform X2 n=1 Tax=Aphis gossypii TaxID=80765 RepID=UPI00215928E6|nr:uncharacterized protein LOC126553522 isoform X2 [Aphis gossypii]
MDKKRQKKVTDEQKVLLVSLLENNPRLVSCKFGADFSFDDSIKKWKSIISELESCSTGPKGKSVDDWKRTWSDLKRNVKEKAAKIRSYRATGGGEASKEKLSELEERIVGIIGEIMIEGHKRVHEFGSPCVKKKVINICNQQAEVINPVIQIDSEVFILNLEDGIENDTPNNSPQPMNEQENILRKKTKQEKTEIDYQMYMEQMLQIEMRKAVALDISFNSNKYIRNT